MPPKNAFGSCEELGLCKNARIADNDLPDIDPWDHVCLGSYYEGFINPQDVYFYASDLVRL